jgi:hypothetical protein
VVCRHDDLRLAVRHPQGEVGLNGLRSNRPGVAAWPIPGTVIKRSLVRPAVEQPRRHAPGYQSSESQRVHGHLPAALAQGEPHRRGPHRSARQRHGGLRGNTLLGKQERRAAVLHGPQPRERG